MASASDKNSDFGRGLNLRGDGRGATLETNSLLAFYTCAVLYLMGAIAPIKKTDESSTTRRG
jgi:hypothetical protein